MAKRDNERAARALVEALLLGDDSKVAKKHGFTLRTLQNYRAALSDDPELSSLFVTFLRETEHQTWLEELDSTMQTVLKKITQGLEHVEPETIADVLNLANIVDVLAEIRLSRDMYGVDEQTEGAAPQGTGAQSGTRGPSTGAAPFGPS